jgi:hypothetical protein
MPKLKLKKGQCVRLKWLDSNFAMGWQYHNNPGECLPIESIGWVHHVSENWIEIVSTKGTVHGFLNPLCVPSGCILECKIIK